MSGLKLITYPGDFRAFKCLVAARYNNVTVNTVENFEIGKDDKTAEFLAMSPLGKVPVLSTPQGPLLESNAIARYIARMRNDTELMGSSFWESAQVDSWIDWCNNELELQVTMWIYPIFGFMPPNKKQVDRAKIGVETVLAVLEKHLQSRVFMVGRKVTLADIVLVGALVYPMKMVFDAKFRSKFPSVTRWFMTCVAFPEFKDVVNEVNLCQREMPLPKGKPKKDGKKGKKEQKKKQEKKPKKEKKKRAPRPKHPLDALPKSSFVMDTWKRTYSNSKPDYYKCMEWLWPNFDAEGYSLWKATFKFQEENKTDWLVSNKIGGYIQRLDAVRKWVFGVMAVLDTKAKLGHYVVEGYWMTRGQDIKYIIEATEESETFRWEKIDFAKIDDATKQRIADQWCGEKLADGTLIDDQAIFK